MNKELNLLKEKQELNEEHVYLEKEEKRLETVIDAQTKRDEIENRKREINERLLEINIISLKKNHNE